MMSEPSNAHPEATAVPPPSAQNPPEVAPVDLPSVLRANGSNGSNGSNGLPSHSSRRVKAKQWSKRTRLLVTSAVIVLTLTGTVAAYFVIEKPFSKKRTDLVTAKVKRGTLELKIVERGQLESANNSDIVCQIKAKTQGGSVATTIRWLVDDGTRVQYNRPKEQVKDAWVWDEEVLMVPPWNLPVNWPTGAFRLESVSDSGQARCVKVRDGKTGEWIYADLVMELDDSSLQDQLVTQRIALDGAKDEELQAEKALAITLAQAEADIQAAGVAVEVAEINLKKFQEGDYISQVKDLEGQIKNAQADAEQQIDRVAWANRMLKKNFQTASQAQTEQLKLESYELTLAQKKELLRVLTKYTKRQQEITLRGEVATKKAALANVRSKAQSQEAKDRSLLTAKRSVYSQQQGRYRDILEQLQKCKVWAPRDGIAVYYIPEQARWGVGSRQSIVAQGENVSEGQKMMQIPDLQNMRVSTKVHEALAPKVHRGQNAMVRVESFYDQPLKGKVEFVATVAASESFLAADVRVYKTNVTILEPIEGLRPGSNAEVTIVIGDAITNALLVPVESIVGGSEMGEERKVFVLTADGPKERKVKVGKANAEYVQITDGLEEGEDVVLNPKTLVGDKVKTRKPGEGVSGPEPKDKKAGPGKGPGKGPGAVRPRMGGLGAGGPGGAPPEGGQFDPKQMEERRKALFEKLRKAPKERRKAILEQVPEAYREMTKQAARGAGIDIPD